MTALVSPLPERELIDGARFYAAEVNAELGLAFIAEFERAVSLLCELPRLGPVLRGEIRRLPLRRFP
ncbi:MAG: hypothetical protein ACKVVP_21330 [Chloroflexota bacterium]